MTVAYGEPVHHVMQFDPADPGYLYLMTSHQVRPEPQSGEAPGRAELSCLPCLCAAAAAAGGALSLTPGLLVLTSQRRHRLCRAALFPVFPLL